MVTPLPTYPIFSQGPNTNVTEQVPIDKQPAKKLGTAHSEAQRILNPQAFPSSPPLTPISRERIDALASHPTHFLAKIHEFITYILSLLREAFNALFNFATFKTQVEDVPTEFIPSEKAIPANSIETDLIQEPQPPIKRVQEIKQLYEAQLVKDPISTPPVVQQVKTLTGDEQHATRVIEPVELKEEDVPALIATSPDKNEQAVLTAPMPEIKPVEAQKLTPKIKDKPDHLSLAVRNLMEYFQQYADFSQKGIFRESGSKPNVDQLLINLRKSPTNKIENLQLVPETNEMAVALKELFGQMELFGKPELRDQIIAFDQEIKSKSQEEKIRHLRQLVDQLSHSRAEDLKLLLEIFERVCQQSATNLMTARNLAIAFGPRLCPLPLTITDQTAAIKVNASIVVVAEHLINFQKEIFS